MNKIINNADDVKLIVAKFEWLKNRAIDLLGEVDCFDTVENLEVNDNDLTIYYTTYSWGETEYHSETVPVAWLFLEDDELAKAKKEKREAEKEAERQQKELNEIARMHEQEQKEREEYERLKAKLETIIRRMQNELKRSNC